MTNVPRSSHFGFPIRFPRSVLTEVRFAPTLGFTDAPDLAHAPGSITSGQNVWIWSGRLQHRPRLAMLGTNNVLADVPTGAWLYDDVIGVQYPMISSKRTLAYLNGDTWTPLTYASAVSNLPPSGGVNDFWYATSVYLPRADTNIAVITNGVDPLFAWGGPQNGTTYSTLSEAPIAKDVAVLQDHVVAWNIRELSSASQLVTRVQWSVRGDPENWDDPTQYAGSQDLLDMRGVGTRVFEVENELILATDQELWRARWLGAPYVFDFSPLNREIGIPFPRAAMQTPLGLFWLGADLMVYRYTSAGITEVGGAIQRTLHDDVADGNISFFGYHPDARQLTLYYTNAAGTYPRRGLTLNLLTGTWTPQRFSQQLVVGFQSPFPASHGTQWNELVGSFAAQTLTYNQLLGIFGGRPVESVVASAGTAFAFSHSAASDDGQTVTHEAVLGTQFAGSPSRRKYVDQVGFDLRTDSASSFSAAVSADLGKTYVTEQQFAISAQSNTSQYLTNWSADGVYHTVRVRCDSPSGFELAGVVVRARFTGETL